MPHRRRGIAEVLEDVHERDHVERGRLDRLVLDRSRQHGHVECLARAVDHRTG